MLLRPLRHTCTYARTHTHAHIYTCVPAPGDIALLPLSARQLCAAVPLGPKSIAQVIASTNQKTHLAALISSHPHFLSCASDRLCGSRIAPPTRESDDTLPQNATILVQRLSPRPGPTSATYLRPRKKASRKLQTDKEKRHVRKNPAKTSISIGNPPAVVTRRPASLCP